MAFSYKPAGLTKTWKITLFCFCILLIYVITWILVGDYNAVHQQWMIANRGSVWHGTITDSNYIWLWNTYQSQIHHADSTINGASDFMDKYGSQSKNIEAYQTMFNPLVLLPMLLPLILAIGLPLIMKIFKLMNIDTLPFSLTLSLSAIIFYFTGLIPHTFSMTGIWIIRVVILLSSLLIFFVLSNNLINHIIAGGYNAEESLVEYTEQLKEKQEVKQTLTDLTNEYRKQDDVTYIEEK